MSKKIRIMSAALALGLFALPVMAAQTNAPAATGPDPVVAKVNNEVIHRSDVIHELQLMGPQAQQMPPQMIYPQLLQKLIATRLVSAQGYAENLQNDKDVRAQVKQAQDAIVAEAYVHNAIQPKLTEDKIKSRYNELASKYKPQDEVRARHILVASEDEANDVIKQLKGGADFAKLAEEKSKDTGSAKNGGDLGYFAHDAMVKPFADAAFAMKIGDVSDKPIKTEFGYHIIKVEDKRKSSAPPLTEVRDQIANQLGQELTNELVKGLEAKAKIERFNIDGSPLKAASSAPVSSGAVIPTKP